MMAAEEWSRRKARIAGACYLVVIGGGVFAESIVRGQLIAPGSAEATALAISARAPLWRSGIAVHLAYLVATVPLAVLLYELLKSTQATLARLALVFSIMCSTIEAVSLLLLMVPLVISRDQMALAGLGDGQAEALGYIAVRLFGTGFSFGLLFFAGFCILIGLLVRRSRVVPKLIGSAMVLSGCCYLTNSMAGIIAPFAASLLFPWILLPCFVAELSLALWLLVKSERSAVGRQAASAIHV